MPFPSVTYTFSNGSTADATQVNQDFTDLINGMSDGTKNLNISALTAAGATVLNGAVTLGASTSNLIVFNGAVNSTVPVNTNTSYDLGSSTKGFQSLYIGASSTFTCRLLGGTQSASWTLTLPTGAGTSNYVLQTDGSGVSSWTPRSQYAKASKTANYTAVSNDEIILCDAASVGAFTVTLPTASGVTGKTYWIKKTDAGTNGVTIATTSAQTIDTRASSDIILASPNDFLVVQSDGSNWTIVGKKESKVVTQASGGFTNSGNGASGNYGQLTSNSVTLGIGQWDIEGYFLIGSGGGGTSVGIHQTSGFYAANGANSSSTPTALTGDIRGDTDYTNPATTFGAAVLSPTTALNVVNGTPPIRFFYTATASTTIYLVPRIIYTVAGGSTVALIRATRVW
jgi:hypothetical protein